MIEVKIVQPQPSQKRVTRLLDIPVGKPFIAKLCTINQGKTDELFVKVFGEIVVLLRDVTSTWNVESAQFINLRFVHLDITATLEPQP